MRCWWCGGLVALRPAIIEPTGYEPRCINCARSTDFERELKLKQLKAKKHRDWQTYGSNDFYRK